MATADFKEGDWSCPACGDHQFKRNTQCRKCGEANPEAPDTAECKWCQKGECWDHGQIKKDKGKGKGKEDMMQMMYAMMFGGGGGGGDGSGYGWKPGDWKCAGCGDHQFAKNETCRKCGEAKPADAGKGGGKAGGKGCKWCEMGECWSHGEGKGKAKAKGKGSSPY
eukprot:CAMPEP_0177180388 /NCGR_PEP_ID=MMETSP0367-20130122/15367_1 /TAXON_ID=447022 ORGANISM="Scrippsiella hangoei-like, Strain SHHI-4" /NCGR_SAMPLE_ID=MMETSP0367 /ASSEMBLY_ACC=CAM_ASM_000362 /LENGTH=165 /DNA_ID=CAMNT_0018627173 /DNA_START=71 /DNA_END=568 /DNA_ORIENTATION=+